MGLRGKISPMSSASPTLIAIETSTELASVALWHRGGVISRDSSGAQTHSMKVPGLIQSLLEEAGLTLAQCEAIAFGCGPGSFTGVRTACGLAQGLAFGAQIPVVPVVTLLAMAEQVRSINAADNLAATDASAASDVLAVLDARMGEVYWAQYRYVQGDQGQADWQVVTEPRLSSAAQVEPAGTPALCGNGLLAYAAEMKHLNALLRLPEVMPHAVNVAKLAVSAVSTGNTLPARDAQPLYLRNKVALTTQERMAGAAT